MSLPLTNTPKADLLVVDDTPANLQLLTGLLCDQGYVVRGALNGKLALEAVAQQPPDLILLDIRMPEMDGFEVCAELKRRPESRKIPIIFISALTDIGDKVRAFESGGVDYVTKPFQDSEVLVRVRTHLDLANTRKSLEKALDRIQEQAQELTHSEQKFRDLYNQSPELLMSVDESSKRIVECNETLLKVLGYESEEVIGKDAFDFYHPDSADVAHQAFQQFLTTGRAVNVELQVIKKGGEKIDIFQDMASYTDPASSKKLTRSVWRDITKRKQIEKRLQESEGRLKESQHTAKLGWWTLDLQTNKLDCSDEVFRIFEIDKKNFAATYPAFLDNIHPDDRDLVDSVYTQSLKTKEPYHMVHRLLMKDGRIKYVSGTCKTDFDDQGKALVSVGVLQDISELKKAEEVLKQANEKLEELDKLKSMFVASMSHELRTPLNSIIGFTSLLLQGISGELNDEQKANLSRVSRAGKHLLDLVIDVIDVSKIEAGRIDVCPQHFSLKDAIDEVVEVIQPLADKKKLALKIVASSWPQMYTDHKRLMQCLLNYLSNAVKYTEQGAVTISIRELGVNVEIAVRDTGIGISDEDFPKLFEAFERLDTHLRVRAGGTGLGLYLTKKITTVLLQGTVTVKSQLGEGSTFIIQIPKQVVIDMKQVEEARK